MRLYKVNSCEVSVVNSEPKTLVIHVMGSASSTGWTQVELGAWVYITPPADGIYDFDLIGKPPFGMALQVITPVATSTTFPDPPENFKGVRIHATSNNLESIIDNKPPIDFPDAGIITSGIFPWPGVSDQIRG